jgi:hypothetical protein
LAAAATGFGKTILKIQPPSNRVTQPNEHCASYQNLVGQKADQRNLPAPFAFAIKSHLQGDALAEDLKKSDAERS